jgi:hypothetical protein
LVRRAHGKGGAGTQSLFFADGPNDESDGVFGMVNMAPAIPKPPTTAMPASLNAAPTIPAGSTTAAQTGTMAAAPDAASVDRFFAIAVKVHEPLSFTSHRAKAQGALGDWDLNV